MAGGRGGEWLESQVTPMTFPSALYEGTVTNLVSGYSV